MGYFVTDRVGLIIAFLNVITFLLLVYMFLKAAAEGRSRLLRVLDRIFAPTLSPLRRVLPAGRLDLASIVLAAVLQIVAFALRRAYT
jgi:uncharacterized protein YggT (Ycf19 family)